MNIKESPHPLEIIGEKFVICESQRVTGMVVRNVELASKTEIRKWVSKNLHVRSRLVFLDDVIYPPLRIFERFGANDQCVMYSTKMANGDGFTLLMSQAFWRVWPEKRTILVRIKAEYLKYFSPDHLCRRIEYEDLARMVDVHFPWTPQAAARRIQTDIESHHPDKLRIVGGQIRRYKSREILKEGFAWPPKRSEL